MCGPVFLEGGVLCADRRNKKRDWVSFSLSFIPQIDSLTDWDERDEERLSNLIYLFIFTHQQSHVAWRGWSWKRIVEERKVSPRCEEEEEEEEEEGVW